jgi:hypothetical protein
MAKKSVEVDNVRLKLPVKLHKRVMHDALDYDMTVSELVSCVLGAYADMPVKQRTQMIRDCKYVQIPLDSEAEGEHEGS